MDLTNFIIIILIDSIVSELIRQIKNYSIFTFIDHFIFVKEVKYPELLSKNVNSGVNCGLAFIAIVSINLFCKQFIPQN
jgi:hypothetical protein